MSVHRHGAPAAAPSGCARNVFSPGEHAPPEGGDAVVRGHADRQTVGGERDALSGEGDAQRSHPLDVASSRSGGGTRLLGHEVLFALRVGGRAGELQRLQQRGEHHAVLPDFGDQGRGDELPHGPLDHQRGVGQLSFEGFHDVGLSAGVAEDARLVGAQRSVVSRRRRRPAASSFAGGQGLLIGPSGIAIYTSELSAVVRLSSIHYEQLVQRLASFPDESVSGLAIGRHQGFNALPKAIDICPVPRDGTSPLAQLGRNP